MRRGSSRSGARRCSRARCCAGAPVVIADIRNWCGFSLALPRAPLSIVTSRWSTPKLMLEAMHSIDPSLAARGPDNAFSSQRDSCSTNGVGCSASCADGVLLSIVATSKFAVQRHIRFFASYPVQSPNGNVRAMPQVHRQSAGRALELTERDSCYLDLAPAP